MLRFALAAVLLSVSGFAQQASYTYFGAACAVMNASRLTMTGLPRLGGDFTVEYSGPNHNTVVSWNPYERHIAQPVLVTGISDRSWGPMQLPYAMPFGGCSLMASGEVMLPMPPASGGGFLARCRIAVPNDIALLGATVFQQWVTFSVICYDQPCYRNAMSSDPLVSSNGGKAVIGL